MPTDTATPSVRAKFRCHSVRTIEGQRSFQGPMMDPTTEVHLSAVYGDGSDNASWSKETPQGFVKMVVTNPDDSAAFVAGQDYFLDFTPVPVEPVEPVAAIEDGTLGLSPAATPEPAPTAAQETPGPAPSPEPAPAQAA